MFDAIKPGAKIARAEFDLRDSEIHGELLKLQRQLAQTDKSIVIVIAGVEGAGKGDVVRLIHRWLDVRNVSTHAFWQQTEEDEERPRFWRFWQTLPARGRIAILFGSWYTAPIVNATLKKRRRKSLEAEAARIRRFEKLLTDDNTCVIKIWFHLSKADHAERVGHKRKPKAAKSRTGVSPIAKAYARHYQRFIRVSSKLVKKTDRPYAQWKLINAGRRRHRDLAVGQLLVAEFSACLNSVPDHSKPPVAAPAAPLEGDQSKLDQVAYPPSMAVDVYREQLEKYQRRLYKLTWLAHQEGISTVAAFEGWDAAGKGGAIRRVTQAMDGRLYRVVSIAAPNEQEKAQHYLWRFWRQLPRAGYSTLFDRSWYGRVLVERVEKFATTEQWQRAYDEINEFEEQLVENRIVLLKYWLHIDHQEQLRRFQEREATPNKQHKITAEDWRNRERWEDYEGAVADMIARTSTAHAKWKVIAGNDKYLARISVLKHFCKQLSKALDRSRR